MDIPAEPGADCEKMVKKGTCRESGVIIATYREGGEQFLQWGG
jgi:hypothetical protein